MANGYPFAFAARSPWVIPIQFIYDPDIDPPLTGSIPTNDDLPYDIKGIGKTIPAVNTLAPDTRNGNRHLYVVTHVNPQTFKSTIERLKIPIDEFELDDLNSIVSYRNDIFRIYYDTRYHPTHVRPSSTCITFGTDIEYYQLITFDSNNDEVIISQYYDTDGHFTGDRIPLVEVVTPSGRLAWAPRPCSTMYPLEENLPIIYRVFDSHGSVAAEIKCFAKDSPIVNENPGYQPTISNFRILSSQLRSNKEIFIYEKQDTDSLSIRGEITYDDGTVREVTVDGSKCRLYGLENFTASYAELQQPLLMKYYLDPVNEPITPGFGSTGLDGLFIYAEANLIVVPNELAATIKVSVIPIWNTTLSRYVLKFWAYTVDRTQSWDVTANTTIPTNAFIGTLYGTVQEFTFEVNMTRVSPSIYGGDENNPAVHRQKVAIRLQPVVAYERYTTRDSSTSTLVYGIDTPTSRRPQLKFDTTRNQYFVSTIEFPTVNHFLKAFYVNATPPYRTGTEEGALNPTHFVMRDISGAMVIADFIPVEDYHVAFNVLNSPTNRFVGQTVVVEFIRIVNGSTNLLLFGVPVECSVSAGGYTGP